MREVVATGIRTTRGVMKGWVDAPFSEVCRVATWAVFRSE